MCTVTVLVDPGGYLVVHNRDESRRRPRGEPPREREGELPYLAPLDPEGGGTWIGVNSSGLTVCVLNGDRPPAAPPPPAPRSRGLVALALLEARGVDDAAGRALRWARDGNLRSRTFELILAGLADGPPQLARLAWDGERLTRDDPDTPFLGTSSLFDADGAARERGAAFRELGPALEGLDPAERRSAVAAWHASHLPAEPGGGPLSVCMHRVEARTVSRTVVDVRDGRAMMDYHDGWPCREGPGFSLDLGLGGR